MSEVSNVRIQTASVGYGRINATWVDDTAIWVSDYFPRINPEYEKLQYERRKKSLLQDYKKYGLLDPTIDILDTDIFGPETGSTHDVQKLGSKLLQVTTWLIPYVDPAMIQPSFELRMPAPDPEDIQKLLVSRKLNAGGQAIYNAFGSAMTPDPSRQ
jgi:hypothetical protein